MDELYKLGDVYCAKNYEKSTHQCSINLQKRLPLLSNNKESFEDCTQEWCSITGQPSSGNKKLCLCGMYIEDIYYFKNNLNGNICQIGSVCIKRINKKILSDYKKSLKVSGTCWLCNTTSQNIETHYNSESHKNKYKKYMDKFKDDLLFMYYIKSIEIKEEEKILKGTYIENLLEKYIQSVLIKYKNAIDVSVNINTLKIDNYYLVDKNSCMKTFSEIETDNSVSLHITIRNLKVKYLPDKYNKLVCIPDNDTIKLINYLHKHANRVVQIETYTKNRLFGSKPSKELKEKINRELKVGDLIDIIVTYNGITCFQEKWYGSFTLQNFKKIKNKK